MTFIETVRPLGTDQRTKASRIILAAVHRVKRYASKRTKRETSSPTERGPISRIPTSQEVTTNLTIRAGFTAGPW